MGQNGMQMLAMIVPLAAVGALSYYLLQRRRKRSDRARRSSGTDRHEHAHAFGRPPQPQARPLRRSFRAGTPRPKQPTQLTRKERPWQSSTSAG
jgi:hypothetical protein